MKDYKSNIDLIKLLKKGDIIAFDTIYKKYSNRLYCFVLKYIKQEEDAKGIVQEVFIKIWESKDKIDIYSSFESFLFTIAYNSTISLLRKRLTEARYIDYLKSLNKIENSNDIIDEIQYNELKGQIHFHLNQLTPRQREIYKLSREDGLSHNEIAKKLNVSVSTVKNHMVTTLAFLRSRIRSRQIISVLFVVLFL